MKFTVVIAASRSETIRAAIESVANQTHHDWELFAITQGASQDTRAVVERCAEKDARIHSLHVEKIGASRARNAGVVAGSGDVVCVIDDDCEARPDWLTTMEGFFAAYPDVGLVGGAVVAPAPIRGGLSRCSDVTPAESIYDARRTPGAPPKGWDWIGCNVGIRRSTLERAGAFDPYLGPGTDFPAAEDTDYKLRLEGLGIPMGATPRLVVHHTFGRRYGFRAALDHSTGYAYGNGGLAGKLTLLGDRRGEEWLRETRRECLTGWLRKPYRLPKDLNRLRNYRAAYRLCLSRYRACGNLLEPA